MSLDFARTIDTGSLTLRDAVTNPAQNTCVFIETAGTLRQFNLTSGSQVGSSTTVQTTPVSVVILDSAGASACVAGTSSGTWQVVELATNYITSFSPGTAMQNIEGQLGASDPANKIAMFAPNTTRTVIKYDANTFTRTTYTLNIPNNDQVSAIVYKEANRFLIGTFGGQVYEIDQNGVIKGMHSLQRYPGNVGFGSTTPAQHRVARLQYYDGFVIANCKTGNSQLHVIDWTTKTEVYKGPGLNQSTSGMIVSNVASGVCITARGSAAATSNHNPVFDTTVYNYGWMRASDFHSVNYSSSPGLYIAAGINPNNSLAWALQETIDDIRVYTLGASSINTSRTISTPNGEDFRVIMLDVTDGVGNSKILLDTYSTSPRTLHIPSGRNIWEIIKINTGTVATWDVSKYTS